MKVILMKMDKRKFMVCILIIIETFIIKKAYQMNEISYKDNIDEKRRKEMKFK